jgi:beta-hydroxylase
VNDQAVRPVSHKKIVKKVAKRVIALLIVAYIYWPIALVYVITGVYDVARQKSRDKKFLFYQYFLVNGSLAWLFSPLNTLVDILCLPFINKQVYALTDLPQGHIDEINQIINECPRAFLVSTINDLALRDGRSMLMYKWYGFNIENEYTVPLFHRDFKKILTIGVSSFKANTSTRKHFGWLRAGIRVLINIDETVDEGAYIVVNDKSHVWKTDGQLYIFDDTVMHISYNQTNSTRNCLFIDIVRPSYLEFVLVNLVKLLGIISKLPIVARFSEWKIIR